MSGRKLLFLATEDWFVKSHFAPLLARAKAEGFEVVVAARLSGSDLGARVIEMPFARGSLSLMELLREVRAFRAVLAAERPDIVHALSLKPVVNCLIGAGQTRQALAVTGLGYFAVSKKPLLRFIRSVLALGIRRAVSAGRAVLVVENEFDRRWVEGGRALRDDRVFLMPGAGVDPEVFTVTPEPEGPIVVGVVTRLVRSKGVDLVVEAVRRLRRSGLDVRLRVAGAADHKNPESVGAEELADWKADPAIELVGAIQDVPAFWSQAHIACLPSRGGEGLPRSLIEAASCGRPIVTADVPGCGDFVRDGVTGFVTAADDVDALAARLGDLVEDGDLRRRMGEAARALVVNGYTEEHAAAVASRAWRALLRD
jgi:glycosyltransferase involved in cell wall biosynthesis